jgi:HD-GYP domain-containing protein (c-di-GMP phosphodiesterase class II)
MKRTEKPVLSAGHFITPLFLGSVLDDALSEFKDDTSLHLRVQSVRAHDTFGLYDNLVKTRELAEYFRRLRTYDPETYRHCLKVGALAFGIGLCLDLAPSRQYDLMVIGLLHDIGKLEIPREILLKPGRLTRREFDIIREHPVFGRNFISSIFAHNTRIVKAVFEHHERPDGKGYGSGLHRGDIDEYAQIVSLADVWDALSSKRVYKESFPFEECARIVREGSGSRFNPVYVEALFKLAGAWTDPAGPDPGACQRPPAAVTRHAQEPIPWKGGKRP